MRPEEEIRVHLDTIKTLRSQDNGTLYDKYLEGCEETLLWVLGELND